MNLTFTPQAATAASGAATLNAEAGVITSESLTTAAGATYTLTLQNGLVTANSVVMAAIRNGSNNAGDPSLSTVAPGNGVITIVVTNRHASAALNGTLKIAYVVFN